jgi:hypothetical protein
MVKDVYLLTIHEPYPRSPNRSYCHTNHRRGPVDDRDGTRLDGEGNGRTGPHARYRKLLLGQQGGSAAPPS